MSLRGHLWTVAPLVRHRLRRSPFLEARPWETALEDPKVGTVRLSGWLREAPGNGEILVLVHGLGGGTESHYLGGGVAAAEAAGISSLRVNLRGSDRRGEDFYHAGLTADLHAALASGELRRYERIYVLGYSLGGHLTLRLGTEAGDPRLAAVAAICAPLDLALSQREIDSLWRWPYRRYLLKGLLDIYAAVAARRPVALPVEQARRIRTIREWDDRIVAPRHGFAGAEDYYARESVAPRLPDLRVPALLLASEWDPMVPAHTIRAALTRPAPRLKVRWVAGGGHDSFPRTLEVDRQAVEWLRGSGDSSRAPAPPAAPPTG